ncbi:Hypothetical protein TES1_1547 [Thermococcus paralvinellae]|uniref:Uncharacterized protein n=2 Tax=Thermococcus paralvinellae TaxID=582419 RepID=W0I902_9EURY|nr:Hypothetical protein TES1_1547 [Thermococcus paralvinellae]
MPRWTGLHNFFNGAEIKIRKVMGIQVSTSLGQLFPFVSSWLQLHPATARIIVLFILFLILSGLIYNLFKESRDAFVLYLLVLFMSVLWFFDSEEFVIRLVFLDSYSSSLIHLSFLLLLSCFVFYLAPKPSREFGFLIYGLTFASPTFRETIKTFDRNFFALFFFILTLAVIMNFSFTLNTSRITSETFLLYIFAAVTVALNIYASIILLAFIITLPKGYRKDYIYIGLMVIGTIVLLNIFGASTLTKLVTKNSPFMLTRFIKESLVQLVLLCYLFVTNFKIAIRMRGQILFLLILTVVYLPLLTIYSPLFAPLIVIVSTLSIRLTHKLYLVTQT